MILQERFERFHKNNPAIYEILVKLCFEAKAKGLTKIGIAMLWEVMRWNLIGQTQGNEKFKLNNDYKSRYARLIMESEKELDGFFELRILTSQN